MKKYLVLALLVILVLATGLMVGCGQSQEQDAYAEYKSSVLGFSMIFPAGWDVEQMRIGEVRFSPPNSLTDIRVMVMDLDQMTLKTAKEWASFVVEATKVGSSDFKLISLEPVAKDDSKAWKIAHIFGVDLGEVFRADRYVFSRQGMLYDIMMSAPESKFDSYANDFELAWESLEFSEVGLAEGTTPTPTPTFAPQLYQEASPPAGFTVEQQLDVDLNGDGKAERALVGKKAAGIMDTVARLDVFTPMSTGQWRKIVELPDVLAYGCGIELVEESVTSDRRKQLAFSIQCGSGAYLTYWLIGYDGGSAAAVLLHNQGLFKGEIELHRGALAEWDGGCLTILHWDGKQFVGQRTIPTAIPSTKVVRYWIEATADGQCVIRLEGPPEVELRVGEKLQLLRCDLSECAERLFVGGVLEWSGQHGVLETVQAGEGGITIVPGGYSLDSFEIRVVVTK